MLWLYLLVVFCTVSTYGSVLSAYIQSIHVYSLAVTFRLQIFTEHGVEHLVT